MKKLIFTVIISVFFFSCGSSKSEAELAAETKAFSEIRTLIDSGNFEFNADVMYPLQTMAVMQVSNKLLRNTGNNGGRVSLATGYKLKIKNDSAIANLPFIGEKRMGNAYINGDDVGIIFKDKMQDYKIDNSDGLELTFNVNSKVESYEVIMKFFADRSADVNIISSHRTSVKYRGRVRPSENYNNPL